MIRCNVSTASTSSCFRGGSRVRKHEWISASLGGRNSPWELGLWCPRQFQASIRSCLSFSKQKDAIQTTPAADKYDRLHFNTWGHTWATRSVVICDGNQYVNSVSRIFEICPVLGLFWDVARTKVNVVCHPPNVWLISIIPVTLFVMNCTLHDVIPLGQALHHSDDDSSEGGSSDDEVNSILSAAEPDRLVELELGELAEYLDQQHDDLSNTVLDLLPLSTTQEPTLASHLPQASHSSSAIQPLATSGRSAYNW